jgi:hypothetical protein
MLVISTITPLVPLVMPSNIPLLPLIVPQPGQQHYFLLKGIPIQMSCATMVPALCRGILSDQQQPSNHLVQCGCMFTSHQAAIILGLHYFQLHWWKWGEPAIHSEQPLLMVDDQTFYISNHSDNWLHSILHTASCH